LDDLLDKYPQVEAAYNDYKQKTMATRGDEWSSHHSLNKNNSNSHYIY
jgi:hypothetical protein